MYIFRLLPRTLCVCVCVCVCVRVRLCVCVLSGVMVTIIRSTYPSDLPVQQNQRKLASLCFKPLGKANECHKYCVFIGCEYRLQAVCIFVSIVIRGQGACLCGTVHACLICIYM